MYLYKPLSLILHLPEDEIMYMMPNLGSVQAYSCYPSGIHEKPIIDWLLDDIFPAGKTFVDIGANIGTYTLRFAKNPKITQVYSFEPQSFVFKALNMSVVLNDFQNVVLHKYAIGSLQQAGELVLKIVDDAGGSSVCDLPIHSTMAIKGTEIVQCRTLDSFNIKNIGLIKIDIEGNELEALQGAVETLENSNWPAVIFEACSASWYADKKQEIIQFVKSLGYEVTPVNCFPEMLFCGHS